MSHAARAVPTTEGGGTGSTADHVAPYVGFVIEDHLGHATHAENLLRELDRRGLTAAWMPIPFPVDGLARHVPGYGSNWTVRAGVRARRAIARAHRDRPLDALFVHTQVAAVLSSSWFARVPAVVSLDATPRQIDELGGHYGHATAGGRVEQLKLRANRRSLCRARRVVAWSAWAADSVVADYGVPPDAVEVIPPGIDLTRWRAVDRPDGGGAVGDGPLRVLFVGGDLVRKGGDVLLEAVASVAGEIAVHLDLVTTDPAADRWVDHPAVTVHRGITPNSDRLLELAGAAHVFCLPTRGDCLPLALLEAAATGLATISTGVAAIGEVVEDGVTGLVVPVGDAGAIARALRELADPVLRRRLGADARTRAEERFDVVTNTGRLLDVLAEVAAAGPPVGVTR